MTTKTYTVAVTTTARLIVPDGAAEKLMAELKGYEAIGKLDKILNTAGLKLYEQFKDSPEEFLLTSLRGSIRLEMGEYFEEKNCKGLMQCGRVETSVKFTPKKVSE